MYGNALFAVLLGPFCLLIIVVSVTLWHCVRPLFFRLCDARAQQANNPHYSLRKRLIIVVMFITFLYQPMAVKAVLMLFTCAPVGDEKRLLYQMDISCKGNTALETWQIVMGCCGIVYAVVLPALKLWALCDVKELIIKEDEDTVRTCKPPPFTSVRDSLKSATLWYPDS